jgi:hypothetical protein
MADNQSSLLSSEMTSVYSVPTTGCSTDWKPSITEAYVFLHLSVAARYKLQIPSYYPEDASAIIKKKAILMSFYLFLKISLPHNTPEATTFISAGKCGRDYQNFFEVWMLVIWGIH